MVDANQCPDSEPLVIKATNAAVTHYRVERDDGQPINHPLVNSEGWVDGRFLRSEQSINEENRAQQAADERRAADEAEQQRRDQREADVQRGTGDGRDGSGLGALLRRARDGTMKKFR